MANITWKDGVTTVATAGILVLERAHFHDWNIPLIADVRWAIAAFLALGLVAFASGYLFDEGLDPAWNLVAGGLGVIGLIVAALGLYTMNSDYLILLMIDMVVFWLATLVRHVTLPEHAGHAHA